MSRDRRNEAARRTFLGAIPVSAAALSGMTGVAGAQEEDEAADDEQPGQGLGLLTVEGEDTVEETVDGIETAVEPTDIEFLGVIDHAENAEEVDEDLPPTQLVFIGNPEIGTPLMQEERSIAVDLPQKLLVWEDDGDVYVTYNDPRYLAARHGILDERDTLEAIGGTLEAIARGEEPD